MGNNALEAALNALDAALRMPMTDLKGQSPLIAYLDDLMKQHSLLLAVHLDVTYFPEYQGIMNATVLELTKDRFLDDQEKQSSLLKGLVGYVWSVNEVAGQLHQHFLVLIKGPLRLCIAEGTDLPRYFAETIVLGTAQCEIVKWEDVDDGEADTLLMQAKVSLNYLRLIQRVHELTTGSSLSRSALCTVPGRFGNCLISASAHDRKDYPHLRAFLTQRHRSDRGACQKSGALYT